jgi:hypothetical protein
MPKVELQDTERTTIRKYLCERFSVSELQTLIFDLGIDDQELPHTTLTEFARECNCSRFLRRCEQTRHSLTTRPVSFKATSEKL